LSFDVKAKVAKEAATLLYFGAEKEYKQAKLRAAQNLGVNVLPSNRDVALELDRIVEDHEGKTRQEQLVNMRKEALLLMQLLEAFCPVLIGSVWRGTVRRGSDIDVAAYSDSPEEILNLMKSNSYRILKSQWSNVNKQGVTLENFHIYAQKNPEWQVEVTVRKSEEAGKKRKCDFFGDEMKGLKIRELKKVLAENPTQKFTP
jgi:predicted nucleotidyltransferase